MSNKKTFGSVVAKMANDVAMQSQEAAASARPMRRILGWDINEKNSRNRSFRLLDDISDAFDDFAHDARIEKGTLANIILREWLEQNKGRREFPIG